MLAALQHAVLSTGPPLTRCMQKQVQFVQVRIACTPCTPHCTAEGVRSVAPWLPSHVYCLGHPAPVLQEAYAEYRAQQAAGGGGGPGGPSLPTIVYSSRTHSQLAQVMKELKASGYK